MRKTPLYVFGELPTGAMAGNVVNFYESDFGSVHLSGRNLFVALGAHKKLKRRRAGRSCRLNCGACVAEAGLNKFLCVVFATGGMVKSISEDW